MPNNANIDERVVEMRIDNRQFVNGAEKTISILDKLKNALKFGDAGKELDDLNRAADKIDFSNVASGVDTISDRFSSMGIVGMRVIQNLTDSVYNFATRTIKDLTVGQISEGFEKYSEILTSTKTILAATRNDTSWVNTYASQMDYVNEKLEQLNWFTDETSFNLSDMVNNIGKFTNAGVNLEDAVRDMEGIATWAGLSGANANEASRAMYNLAQAMAVGEVKLMDWRSIENANMATTEFKQTVLDIASDPKVGALRKIGDGLYRTAKGTEVSVTNFNDALSEGWFTSSILEGALDKFGRFTQALNTAMNDMDMIEEGITTTDVLGWLDKIDAAMEESGDATQVFIDWQNELAETMDEKLVPDLDALHYAYELLSDDELELGRRAFVASQEYKTLDDAIQATKDAVSSGWKRTFEYVIGDAEESKKVWTAIGDELYDIFAASGVRRNQILKLWKKPDDDGISGRDSLLSALVNLYNGIRTYIDPIVEAFDKIFSWGTRTEAAQRLRELTYRFEEFSQKIGLSEEAMEGLTNVFTKVFGGVKKVLGVFKPVGKVIGKAFGYLHDFVDLLFSSFAGEEGFQMQSFMDGMHNLFGRFGDDVGKAWTKISGFLNTLKELPFVKDALATVTYLFGQIRGALSGINAEGVRPEWLSVFEGAESPITNFIQTIQDFFSGLNVNMSAFSQAFDRVGEFVSTIYTGLTGDPEEFKERIKNLAVKALEGIKEALSSLTISDVLEGAKLGVLGYTALQFAQFVTSFRKTADKFGTIPEAVTGILNSFQDTVKAFTKSVKANQMIKIAAAIGILAASMWLLSKVPDDKFMEIAVTLGFLVIALSKVLKNLDKINVASGNNGGNKLVVNILPKLAANLIAIAIFLGVVASAVVKVTKAQKEGGDVWGAFNMMILAMATAVMAMFFLAKISDKNKIDYKAIGKIAVIAAVIRATGTAISKIASLDPTSIVAAGFAIGLVLAAVAAIVYAGKDFKGGVSSVGAILAVTLAIIALVPAFALLSSIGWKGFGVATLSLLVIAGTLLAFMAIANKIGSNPGSRKFATTLIIISGAMLLFAAALAIATPAILTLTTGMIGIVVLLKTLNEDGGLVSGIGLLALLGAALIPLAAAMVIFGAAALLMATSLLIAGAAMLMIGAGMSGAAAGVAILTVTLVPFAKALTEFAQIISENGDLILSILDKVLLGVVMMIMARRMHIALAALSVIVAFVQVIHESGPDILGVIGQIFLEVLQFLSTLIPMVVAFLVGSVILIINKTANMLREKSDMLVDALENLVVVILELLIKVIMRALGDLAWIVAKGLSWILGEDVATEMRQGFIDLGDVAADGLRKGLVNAEAASGEAGANFMDEFAGGAETNMGVLDSVLGGFGSKTQTAMDDTAETASKGGENTVLSFLDGAGVKASDASAVLGKMGDSLAGNFDLSETAGTYGSNFMIGFGNGADDESEWVNQMMANLAGGAAGSFASNLQINSPSKLARSYGRFWDQGFVNGLVDGSDSMDDASSSVAFKMADAMHSALTTAMALAENDFSISPRITPVVDMTNVDASVSDIGSMLSGSQDISFRAGQGISRSMADIEDMAASIQSISDARANMSQDSYEINIYSQPGMDEATLADEVIVRLNEGIVRKGAALG